MSIEYSDSVNKTEHYVSITKPHLRSIKSKLRDLSASNSRHRVGADALINLCEQLGDESIITFLQWAVHPTSGFLPQHDSINPLPDDLRSAFSRYVVTANDTAVAEFNERVQERKKARENTSPHHDFQMVIAEAQERAISAKLGLSDANGKMYDRMDPSPTKYNLDKITDLAAKALEAIAEQISPSRPLPPMFP